MWDVHMGAENDSGNLKWFGAPLLDPLLIVSEIKFWGVGM